MTFEIRRHSVKLVSDTVTLVAASEPASLATLALAPDNAYQTLQEIADLEKQEAALISRKKWLEQQITDLTNTGTLVSKRDEQQALVNNLKTRLDEATNRYNVVNDDPFNYWCQIVAKHSLKCMENVGTSIRQKASDASLPQQQWRFEYIDKIENDKYYYIICKNAQGNCIDVQGRDTKNGANIIVYPKGNGDNQKWKFSLVPGDNRCYKIVVKHSTGCFDVRNNDSAEGAELCQGYAGSTITDNQKFKLEKVAITEDGETIIAPLRQEKGRLETEWNTADAELSRLKALTGLTTTQIQSQTDDYTREKSNLEIRLRNLQNQISTRNTNYLVPVTSSQSLKMSELSGQDPNGLKVQGTLLVGTNPATRLQALESCAGRVTLSYQDTQSIMRQAHYDTAYDRDGKGEEWLPAALSVALKRDGAGNLTIHTSVFANISNQITFEFWAKGGAVLPKPPVWTKLADENGSFVLKEKTTVRYGGEDNQGGHWRVVILDAGTYTANNNLGQQGGNAIDPWSGHPKICQSPDYSTSAPFLRAMKDVDLALEIQLPNRKQEITWKAGNGAQADCIGQQAPASLYRERWTHWAFVKDCDKGEMKIYANGQLWHANQVDKNQLKQSLSGITSAVLDGSWEGMLAELRIWNVALGAREIEANSHLSLSGNEPGLVAYYPISEATGNEARDKTGYNPSITGVSDKWVPCTVPLTSPQAMTFNGTDSYIQLPTMNPDFSQGLTIESWVFYKSIKKWARILDCGNGENCDNFLFANYDITPALRFYISKGQNAQFIDTKSEANPVVEPGKWMHLVATVDSLGQAKIYKNGQEIGAGRVELPNNINRTKNYIGKSNWSADEYFDGQMRDVRLWNRAKTANEIKANMNKILTGNEPGLVANWLKPRLPFNAPSILAEYNRVYVDGQRRKSAMMVRTFALPSPVGVYLLDEQRIEELEMKWIGNAQIKPTLLGFIEGAPPVPSENLTEEDDYNGATSVELVQSNDVQFSWTREQDVSSGAELSGFFGLDDEVSISTGVGVEVQKKALATRIGTNVATNFAYHWQNASTVGASQSLTSTDRLELRGYKESDPRFPHLGNRFVPKNIGYALVVSGMADVYISKLKRSGRMVGYQVLPVEGVPMDVNTITFLMNPAYTMAGSLDGQTGSSATSERFFRHVPEMRNQYGSLYPASYYRVKEAYLLKSWIDKQDKEHEAYFNNFDAGTVDESSLESEIGDAEAEADIPAVEKLKGQIQIQEDKIERLETKETEHGLTPDEKGDLTNAHLKKNDLDQQLQKQHKLELDKKNKENQERQNKIQEQHDNLSARAHATNSFASWQKKMESLQIRAGKRNIVNTYVWDGDGGFHAEEQQFASTVEHSVGGSFEFSFGIGYTNSVEVFGVGAELSGMSNVGLTQTMSKTESTSKGMELHVDLSGVESRGITDYKDYPILPSEKVDRYRFMTFYLEGSTNHWHDFFTEVVDPEWLASNDEEARALRQSSLAAPNKTWRVLHRVTYVERPALMGFGRDLRILSNKNTDDEIVILSDIKSLMQSEINDLKTQLNAVNKQLEQILGKLNTSK
ncbi:MAG: RICIN domain-containing protein [Anaerolineales bacterium]|nr:RICIN domain-containing protein [Anaerolineales bacterium]